MPFNRPPRLQTPLPADVIKIPAPPAIPQKPDKSNWMTVLLPLGAVLLSVVLMVAFMGGSSSSASYLFFLPIMLVSYLVALFAAKSQKKDYEKKVVEGRAQFRAELRAVEEQLVNQNAAEKALRLKMDPDTSDCILIAQRADPVLGERRPTDADFLHVRLGVGKTPVTYKVEAGEREKHEEFEKEYTFIDQVVVEYSQLEAVPIHARLPLTGSIGIAGSRTEVLGVTRAFLSHALVHHWPTELNIAICTNAINHSDWSWAAKVPHRSEKLTPSFTKQQNPSKLPDQQLMTALEAELQRREQMVESQKMLKKDDKGHQNIPLPRLLVVFDYLPDTFRHPAINLLNNKGPELGVYGIFLTSQAKQIPGSCGAVITATGGRLTYNESGPEGYTRECISDIVGIPQVEMLANALSAIEWPASSDESLPPETITFLQLFGAKRVEDLPLEKWWDEAPPFGVLRAPIGRISAASDMVFDLNDRDGSHGPHGLLGGMTGSGKSEVLKAVILALAVTHHPYDINFALIDFKGGAAFNELARLPHTVGVVTDIESNATFAERVIQALSGEIERRKRVLEDARAAFGFGRSHIDEYRNQPVRRPMPRLIIVFDEFAEFKQRNPDESKKLISIARQGRSLGVHLILATQNIAAAVDPEILQNSSFRICLKVSEPQDSMQMIGIPDAINLTRGRAYFSANTRILYQSAFSGASYNPEKRRLNDNEVERIWPDGKRDKISLPQRKVSSEMRQLPATEAGAVVDYINQVAQKMNLKKPRVVWPDALMEQCFLPDLLSKNISGGWDGSTWQPCQLWAGSRLSDNPVLPVLGMIDLPNKQVQYPLQMNAEQGGHLLVFGSAGTGKSTLLRTMVTSLAMTHKPDEAQVYVLDYGGQSALKLLELFPHVGAVVTRLETERAERLVQLIQTEIFRRNNLLREARLDNWLDYNSSVQHADRLPALFLVIDGFRDFKAAFETEFIDSVSALISGGQAAGLYMVAATSLQNDIPNDLFANINMRMSFNQADSTEYFRIVGTPSEAKLLEDAAKGVRPGRGLLRGTPPVEFQAALPTHGVTDREQAGNLIALAEQMRRTWQGTLPQPVLTLPELFTLPDYQVIQPGNTYNSMLGLDSETLSPTGFSLVNDGPAFLIGSVTGQAGKTALLRSWILSLANLYPPEKLQTTIIDFHTRSLTAFRRLPNCNNYVGSKAALDEVLSKLETEIARRQTAIDKAYQEDPENFNQYSVLSRWPHILLIIDDYERFYQAMDSEVPQLADCLLRGSDLGFSFIVSGKMSDLPNSYSDHFIERFRKLGSGVLLGGYEGIDEFNNTRRPAGSSPAGLPPGRGYIIKRGRAWLFQSAAYWQKDQSEEEALSQWFEKWAGKPPKKGGAQL